MMNKFNFTPSILTEGVTLSNEDDELELSFSKKLSKFCVVFNGNFESYKNKKAFEKRALYLINKFNLILNK